MSYRDHDYHSPTGTHPVGGHETAGGSGWGIALVLLVLVAILGLAIVFGPQGDPATTGNSVPAVQQTAPAASGDLAPASPQPMD